MIKKAFNIPNLTIKIEFGKSPTVSKMKMPFSLILLVGSCCQLLLSPSSLEDASLHTVSMEKDAISEKEEEKLTSQRAIGADIKGSYFKRITF